MHHLRRVVKTFPYRLNGLAVLLVVLPILVVAQVPRMNSFSSARATVYLDFDGQTVKGTAWNWDGNITAKHCGLTESNIIEIFERVSEDFRIFNINITTDQDVYFKAPTAKRMRLIVTPTYEWFGHAGGVAFVNSFTWGDETPAWVFTVLLDNNVKYIAEATSHEIGHTLGLQHQSIYDRSCQLVTEYAGGRGEGETGWAPIMGVAYYKNFTTWTYGTSIEGCKVMQNDIVTISGGMNQVGLRTDDHANLRSAATNLSLIENRIKTAGLIHDSKDKDIFRVQLTKKSKLTIHGRPASIAEQNVAANLDMLITLIKNNGDTILRVNPKMSLSASFDTLLNAGTYYIGVDGVSNTNVSDYGSVGWYSLEGTAIPATSTSPVVMRGEINRNVHLLSWDMQDKESIVRSYLEYSLNGVHYFPIRTAPEGSGTYLHEPLVNGNISYRLKMLLPDDSYYYSNTVVLANTAVSLTRTVVRDYAEVRSPGNYEYMVVDPMGRITQRGKLVEGLNNVSLGNASPGVLMMKIFSRTEQLTLKLIKQ